MNNTNKNPPSYKSGFCLAPPTGLEPCNIQLSCANCTSFLRKHRPVAQQVAPECHYASNRVKKAKQKPRGCCLEALFWARSTKMQLHTFSEVWLRQVNLCFAKRCCSLCHREVTSYSLKMLNYTSTGLSVYKSSLYFGISSNPNRGETAEITWFVNIFVASGV